MKPIRLTMQAFGSYGEKTVIDFTAPKQNLFLITGDTGSGKTTIFDAIVYAIYGETGSFSNKKNGTELQSQFVDYGITPYVELTFSELIGGVEQQYTVRRILHHIRNSKRGSGTTEEKESVSLLLPDGSEYAQHKKETDAKLESIVGLTKNQFMQVAMIAQGEFMELLRANSDRKKEMFRKLFHTGLYERITQELGRRCKEKEAEITKIRTVCQTEVAHIKVPEDDPEFECITAQKQLVCDSKKLNIAHMEQLMEQLEALCQRLSHRQECAEQASGKAAEARDAAIAASNRGKALSASFAQIEKAQRELEECSAAEDELRQVEQRIREISAAYDLQALYRRWQDANGLAEKTAQALSIQLERLPDLSAAMDHTSSAEQAARTAQEAASAQFAQCSGRVSKALELFTQIETAEQEQSAYADALNAANQTEQQAAKSLQQFEVQAAAWQAQLQALDNADLRLAQWEIQQQEAEELQRDIVSAKKEKSSVDTQRTLALKAAEGYQIAREQFNAANLEFERLQTAFFDAQAGFLAQEKLKPGKPCPVCGSTDHPRPCVLPENHQQLTREMLDKKSAALEQLRLAQEQASTASGTAAELWKEKDARLEETTAKLRVRAAKRIPSLPEHVDLTALERFMMEWTAQLAEQGHALKQSAEALAQLRKNLSQAAQTRQSLTDASNAAKDKVREVSSALAVSKSKWEGLMQQKEFDTRQAALDALSDATQVKKRADSEYEHAHRDAMLAQEAKSSAEALIQSYRADLPGQTADRETRCAAYQAGLEQDQLSEARWMELTSLHKKEEMDLLQNRLNAHMQKKASAQGALESAMNAVGNQAKPNLQDLEHRLAQADEAYKIAQETLEALNHICTADLGAYQTLTPVMEEQSRILRDQVQMEQLYLRLAGKVTGARMDIETYVQRCYLQQILHAANARFQEMSSGEFALRMVDEAQAGDGKNRGLDLMVYSTVTGKEREVRTLSGGESFMAALSLALGMADQIQANSAAIHLGMMFIDEGFGSLDDQSRNQAVRVLQEMAGGSRLIGIISHVSELKQEIDDQLVVHKNESGSHTHWVIS